MFHFHVCWMEGNSLVNIRNPFPSYFRALAPLLERPVPTKKMKTRNPPPLRAIGGRFRGFRDVRVQPILGMIEHIETESLTHWDHE